LSALTLVGVMLVASAVAVAAGGPRVTQGGPYGSCPAPTGDYEGLALDLRDPRTVHIQGFDADGNPIPSDAPNPTDVFSSSVPAR
jgi:hypothetical protein